MLKLLFGELITDSNLLAGNLFPAIFFACNSSWNVVYLITRGDILNKKKEFGVFYTPKEVVDKVYSLLPMSEINSIIDINCGDGALLRPYDKEKIVLGFDIEPNIGML